MHSGAFHFTNPFDLLILRAMRSFRFLHNLLTRPKQDPWPDPQIDPRHRIYAIGDVHGCADLLQALLGQIQQDSRARQDGRQTICVLLGDYIDRGPDSRSVLDLLSALKTEMAESCILLRGNHEAALAAFLEDPEQNPAWLGYGADQTLRSYGLPRLSKTAPLVERRALRDMLAAEMGPHLELLQGLERFWISGQVGFVHAAIDPDRPLTQQRDKHLYWGHKAFHQGKTSPQDGLCIVHGHYAGTEPVRRAQRICIDTGAYLHGRLTALCLDDQLRFLSTEPG